MNTLIAIVVVLAVVAVCAIFRFNILTLLPWYPGLPKRLDDRIETLEGTERSDAQERDASSQPRS